MEDKNYIYKKLSDGRYIKEIDNKIEHLATAEEDAKLATDIRSLLQGEQGQSGTSGTSGESGTSGRDGQKGDMGRTGLTGPRGQNGTSGSSGSSGQDGTSGINGQDGTSGINGRRGDKGDKGDRGFPGLQGPAGQNGSAGVSGSAGSSGTSGSSGQNGLSSSLFRYNAHTNSYGPPIGTGNIEWNNATQTSATEIYTSHITQDNNDIEVILGGITIGSTLIIQDRNVSENYQKWTITSVAVTTASYVTFGVSYIDGGYSFSNGHDVIIIVQLAGVNGSSGTSGSSGVNGVSGMGTNDFQYRGLINNGSGVSVQTIITNATIGGLTVQSVQGGLPLMWPMRWERGFTYSAIQVEVTTTAVGSTFSFGIYSDNGSNFPGSIIYTSPSINTATSGFKQVITSGTVSASTKYWFVALTSNGNPSFRSLSVPFSIGGLTSSTTGLYGFRTFAAGSLTTFTPSQLQFSTIAPLLVGFIV
jgi:hypothetical protein